MTAIALTIAGSDSSGGAGIQADLKTFAALGVYGASAITALTAQNTQGVDAVLVVPPDFVARQIRVVARDLDIGAIKIGMLATAEIVETVARELEKLSNVPIVLDPVMVAASGDTLLDEDAIDTLRTLLFPRAAVVTPNLPEAAKLLGEDPAKNESEMAAQGRALIALGANAALVKGGHGKSESAVDILVDADGELRLEAQRSGTRNTHGTGCTLSSAIAAELAKGASLREAATTAKAYVTTAIEAADALHVGKGAGPVHHFHALWPNSQQRS
jgi:hydroxymethylpyrimidine/phosphomethylpyrimidine kinase